MVKLMTFHSSKTVEIRKAGKHMGYVLEARGVNKVFGTKRNLFTALKENDIKINGRYRKSTTAEKY